MSCLSPIPDNSTPPPPATISVNSALAKPRPFCASYPRSTFLCPIVDHFVGVVHPLVFSILDT